MPGPPLFCAVTFSSCAGPATEGFWTRTPPQVVGPNSSPGPFLRDGCVANVEAGTVDENATAGIVVNEGVVEAKNGAVSSDHAWLEDSP